MSGNYERDLAKHLDENGFHVIRAPASGAATKRSLPDLFWSRPTETAIAAELKARKEDMAYIPHGEIKSLCEFAAAFNAKPRVVLRVKQDTRYHVIDPNDCEKTEKSLKVTRANAYRTIEP